MTFISCFLSNTMTSPTSPTPLYDILSRMENESSGRSGCMVPLDDDWKERMRALNKSAEADSNQQLSPEE